MNRPLLGCAVAITLLVASSCGGSEDAEAPAATQAEATADADPAGEADSAGESDSPEGGLDFCDHAVSVLTAPRAWVGMTPEQSEKYIGMSVEEREALSDAERAELGLLPAEEQREIDQRVADGVDGMVATAPTEIKADMEMVGDNFARAINPNLDIGDEIDEYLDPNSDPEALMSPENEAAMGEVMSFITEECELPPDES